MAATDKHGTAFQTELTAESTSAVRRYQQMVIGRGGLGALLRFELLNACFGGARGAFGFWARKRFFRGLFRKAGRGLILGRDIVLRHTHRIEIGDSVAIDDGCVLDGRGHGDAVSLTIGSHSIVSRNTVLSSKDGVLRIGEGCNIGAECLFYASHGSVAIEDKVLFAARCYIGGGRYHLDRLDVPILEQGQYFRGDTVIEQGCWLGAGAIVLDGVRIGHDSVVAAGAVVVEDIPPLSIAGGIPARVIRTRSAKPVG